MEDVGPENKVSRTWKNTLTIFLLVWRRERDSNPRCHKDTVDFESTPFGLSGISPRRLINTAYELCRSLA
jgi:hypothetical protein